MRRMWALMMAAGALELMGVEGWLGWLVLPAADEVRTASDGRVRSRVLAGEDTSDSGVTPGTEALGGADVKPGGKSGVL